AGRGRVRRAARGRRGPARPRRAGRTARRGRGTGGAPPRSGPRRGAAGRVRRRRPRPARPAAARRAPHRGRRRVVPEPRRGPGGEVAPAPGRPADDPGPGARGVPHLDRGAARRSREAGGRAAALAGRARPARPLPGRRPAAGPGPGHDRQHPVAHDHPARRGHRQAARHRPGRVRRHRQRRPAHRARDGPARRPPRGGRAGRPGGPRPGERRGRRGARPVEDRRLVHHDRPGPPRPRPRPVGGVPGRRRPDGRGREAGPHPGRVAPGPRDRLRRPARAAPGPRRRVGGHRDAARPVQLPGALRHRRPGRAGLGARPGAPRAGRAGRPHHRGSLAATFTWPDAVLTEAAVAEVAQRFTAALAALAAHAPEPGGWGRTPVDFPLVALAQEDVDALDAAVEGGLAEVWPLTPLQQGMYFHSRYHEHTADDPDGYIVQYVLELTGPLTPQQLRTALDALTDRHPALRASFHETGDGGLVQAIARAVSVPLRVVAWADDGASVAREERSTAFALDRAPLLRVALAGEERPDRADARHRLVVTLHHLVADGWSLPVLF